jgi:hypothetical protein
MYDVSLSFQVLSDVHLEFNNIKSDDIKCKSDNLVLCGDICPIGLDEYYIFVSRLSNKFKNIFIVYGNHEFYSAEGEDMSTLKNHTRFLPKNVYVLDNNVVYIDTYNNVYTESEFEQYNMNLINKSSNLVKVIGSTLWSDVGTSDIKLNDFKCIYTKRGKTLTSCDVKKMFKDNVSYIICELDKEPKIPTVLITHHGPHPVCNGIYNKSVLSNAFVSYIPELYMKNNLKLCLFGHTHSSVDKILTFEDGNSIRFVSNQFGYPFEDQTGYEDDKVVEIIC